MGEATRAGEADAGEGTIPGPVAAATAWLTGASGRSGTWSRDVIVPRHAGPRGDPWPPALPRRPGAGSGIERRGWAAAAALLVLLHAARQVASVASAPMPQQYDYDEGVYAETALVAPPSSLYRETFLSQPPLVVLLLRLAFHVGSPTLVTARLLIVAFSVLWLLALVSLGSSAGRPWTGVFAVAGLLLSPLVLREAHTVHMEVPSEALAALAVALPARDPRLPVWWVASGAVLALAASTKLSAVLALAPLAVLALRSVPSPARARVASGFFGALLGLSAALAAPFADREALHQVVTYHAHLLTGLGPDLKAHAAAIGRGLASQGLLAGGAALGVAVAARSRDTLDLLSIAWLASAGSALLVLTPLWTHHLVFLLSPLALLAGGGAERLLASLPDRARRLAPGAVVGVLALSLLSLSPWGMAPASGGDLEAMVARVRASLPPSELLLTDDPMVAFLARRGVPPALVDTSVARIRAGELSQRTVEAVLGDPRIGGVVLWRGTFAGAFPELVAAAEKAFPVHVAVGRGQLWLRAPAAPASLRPGGPAPGRR
jgi:hypothetical protein